MQHYPVIVIGSGPAGSACAKAVRDCGTYCLVVEKRKLPRDKTCSGIVYGQCQELLQAYFGKLPPAEVRCAPEFVHADDVFECRLDGTQVNYVWELPKEGKAFSRQWINVWRSKFDHWLLRESGADVLEQTRFLGFEADEDLIRVFLRGPDGQTKELTCEYLVGADGALSSIRKAVDEAAVSKAMACMASYAYYECRATGKLRDGGWYVFLNPEFGDIISCAHHKDDMLAVSVGGFSGAKLLPFEKKFVTHLKDAFGVELGERRFANGCSNRLAPPCLGRENVLLVGDAAGVIYLNGEGMSAAIDSGYRAGKSICQAMGHGEKDAAAVYVAASGDILRHTEYCMQNMHFIVPR
jgi:menaquinone-9 beta-reductase